MTRLIVNADDYGFTKGVNQGIEIAAECGVLTSISAMANQPYVEELSEFARRFPHIGVGVHITLTQGKPILPPERVSSLVDETGEFLNYREFLKRSLLGKLSLREAFDEISAQIGRITNLLGHPPDHADVHQHILPPSVLPPFFAALKARGVKAVRTQRVLFIPNNLKWKTHYFKRHPYQIFTFTYKSLIHRLLTIWSFKTPNARLILRTTQGLPKTPKIGWIELINRLPEGCFEWVVHPAIVDDELRQKSQMLLRRQEELELLCSSNLKAQISSNGIKLVRFSEL